MIDLEPLRQRWLQEGPIYERLGLHIEGLIEQEAQRKGIYCTVTHRAKDPASLLKKALRKNYASPYDEIGDKVGVRVVVTYQDAIPAIETAIHDVLEVDKYENKSAGLGHEKLGYLGIHFEVRLPDHAISPEHEEFRGKSCEVQLHTGAQTLWANVSHQLAYKPSQDPPSEILRAINRLAAIVEIFDGEIGRARAAMLSLPGFHEARMLAELEQHFYRLTAKAYDRELSLEIISRLEPALLPEEFTSFGAVMTSFVAKHEAKLAALFEDYRDDTRHILMSQPEALLIFERLEKNRFSLRELWEEHLPPDLLEEMAHIWGVAV